ncbi:hypothetical protein SS50377_25779 [Spironucleus salmonicida]|uniref:Uncharacterized protein n=1 Tax=Spironucleus salmonicida TaxID=348837 RepID=V6LUK1_9EUKA|nr:hypothetical protein SS50377_25779 [Spironucleus salmonicida]|eukprot:EST48245.1 Hypothetical protein SS50377_11587 [Spironucleus salmonicida]
MNRPKSACSLTQKLAFYSSNFAQIPTSFILQPQYAIFSKPPTVGKTAKRQIARTKAAGAQELPQDFVLTTISFNFKKIENHIQIELKTSPPQLQTPLFTGQFRMPKRPQTSPKRPIQHENSAPKFKKLNMSNSSSYSICILDEVQPNFLLTLDDNLICLEVEDSEEWKVGSVRGRGGVEI